MGRSSGEGLICTVDGLRPPATITRTLSASGNAISPILPSLLLQSVVPTLTHAVPSAIAMDVLQGDLPHCLLHNPLRLSTHIFAHSPTPQYNPSTLQLVLCPRPSSPPHFLFLVWRAEGCAAVAAGSRITACGACRPACCRRGVGRQASSRLTRTGVGAFGAEGWQRSIRAGSEALCRGSVAFL